MGEAGRKIEGLRESGEYEQNKRERDRLNRRAREREKWESANRETICSLFTVFGLWRKLALIGCDLVSSKMHLSSKIFLRAFRPYASSANTNLVCAEWGYLISAS